MYLQKNTTKFTHKHLLCHSKKHLMNWGANKELHLYFILDYEKKK